jgi:excisionase family DNA binding protein
MDDASGVRGALRNYCTTREAAGALGVSLRTAQLWVDGGLLDAWKTDGGHRRISLESVQRLLQQKQNQSRGKGWEHPVSESPDRLRILVVEDDNVLLRLYMTRLATWDLPIDLSTAHNGYEALMLIGREQPDLMITDLRMSGIDGFQMLRTVLSSPYREGMEVVVVTGMDTHAIAEAGGLPSGIRCLPKPVPFTELRSIAETLLRRRAALAQG